MVYQNFPRGEVERHTARVKPNNNKKTRHGEGEGVEPRIFHRHDLVWVRNYANGPKWINGKVTSASGPVSYEIEVNGRIVRRHVNQLRKRMEATALYSTPTFQASDYSETNLDMGINHGNEGACVESAIEDQGGVDRTCNPENSETPSESTSEPTALRRSTRLRRPPDFFQCT